MHVLVTGAAGYIGSHAARQLLSSGTERVVGVDSLIRGHRGAVNALAGMAGGRFRFETLDVRDAPALERLMRSERVEAVLHFAGLTQVGESVQDPAGYWSVNAGGTEAVLAAARGSGVERLVFSSSAAVYGAPLAMPISESAPTNPINPYGQSKLAGERMLSAEVHASREGDRPFAAAILRYFNVAGAAPDRTLGEDHRPETHLIPGALQVALGRRPALELFGTDYATPDGTCIRDFVHVEDLVRAHVEVLAALSAGDCRTYNVGLGHGFSVRQVLEECRRVTGHAIPAREHPRRPGDPPVLLADASRIQNELGWRAHHETLESLVASAWEWMRRNPHGYAD